MIAYPDRPAAALGPTDTYATPDEFAASIGAASGPVATERRNLALILATRWVAYRIGMVVTDDVLPIAVPDVNPVPARPAWREATVAAAVRFYRSPDVPWGAAGGLGDSAVYVRTAMPEVELILLGQRVGWGIA